MIVVTAMVFAGCKKGNEPEPQVKDKLIRIEKKLYGYNFGKQNSFDIDWDYYVYDINGNLLEKHEFSTLDYKSNINIGTTTRYKYDEKNTLVEYSESPLSNKRFELVYDGGVLKEKKEYGSNGLTGRFVYEYNDKGQIKKEDEYYFTDLNEVFRSLVFSYDDRGNKTEEIISYPPSDPSGILFYSYDKHDNMLTETYKDLEDNDITVYKSYLYEYNELDQMVEKLMSHPSNPYDYKSAYIYNDEGLVIEEKVTRSRNGDNYFEDWALIKYVYTYQ